MKSIIGTSNDAYNHSQKNHKSSQQMYLQKILSNNLLTITTKAHKEHILTKTTKV